VYKRREAGYNPWVGLGRGSKTSVSGRALDEGKERDWSVDKKKNSERG